MTAIIELYTTDPNNPLVPTNGRHGIVVLNDGRVASVDGDGAIVAGESENGLVSPGRLIKAILSVRGGTIESFENTVLRDNEIAVLLQNGRPVDILIGDDNKIPGHQLLGVSSVALTMPTNLTHSFDPKVKAKTYVLSFSAAFTITGFDSNSTDLPDEFYVTVPVGGSTLTLKGASILTSGSSPANDMIYTATSLPTSGVDNPNIVLAANEWARVIKHPSSGWRAWKL